MAKTNHFTRQDTLHAAIGVIPGFLLICFGYLTPGIAFAIGLLPTSLLGIAPSRKLRLIYGLLAFHHNHNGWFCWKAHSYIGL
jgi:hypothetical protein